jgi:hypothetical protein
MYLLFHHDCNEETVGYIPIDLLVERPLFEHYILFLNRTIESRWHAYIRMVSWRSSTSRKGGGLVVV